MITWVKALCLALALALGHAGSDRGSPAAGPELGALQNAARLPDFDRRDEQFSRFRTEIVKAMRRGPNFAGHYTVVVIGCGSGCRIVFIADNETGEVFDFPYGGEDFYMLNLKFRLASKHIVARWIEAGKCRSVRQIWTGRNYLYVGDSVNQNPRACYD